MMSAVFSVAIFFVVIAIAAVMFFAWIVFLVVRLLVGGVGMLVSSGRDSVARPSAMLQHNLRCQTNGCQALNPSSARFCRRCGRGLPAARRVQVRRAAVW